jgi:ribonuclease HI
MALPRPLNEDEELTCECCALNPHHPPRNLSIVEWENSAEPAESLPPELVKKYHHTAATRQASDIPDDKRPDKYRSEMEKQGIYGDNPYLGHINDPARALIKFEHQPINPHTDIHPNGRYTVQIKHVLTRRAPRTRAAGPPKTTEVAAACIHGPDGRCVGQIEPHRLHMLCKHFNHIQQQQPSTHTTLAVTSFEEEVYRLVLRYREGYRADKSSRAVKMSNHWTTPPPVMEVLRKHLHITQERFASPLNYSQHLKNYWSFHERDQVFGAQWNAYSCQWIGVSQCNPEYEDDDMDKAIRWAIHSAQNTTEPTMAVCVLPHWGTCSHTAYLRWLEDRDTRQYCHLLLKIAKGRFQFRTPDTWEGEQEYVGSPKWDVNIILVGNEAGFTNLQLHLDEHALQTDMLQVLETINKKPIPSITDMGTYKHLRTRLNTDPNQLHECPAETSWISTPNKFKRLPAAVPPNPLPPITWGQKDMHALHLDFPALPCRFQWNDIIYTDGSLRGTKRRSTARNLINPPTNGKGVARSDAGSGIYVPAGKYSPDPVSICLDPAGVGCTNTVNRAELAPIHYVLQQQLGDTIASDSACSLYQVARYLNRPMTMQQHKHKHILERIIQAARSNGRPIHLIKVKAHTGIVGNEHADEAANAAASKITAGTELPKCDAPASAPYHGMYWPTVPTIPPSTTPDQPPYETEGCPQYQWQPMGLGQPLKQLLHEQHRLGYSKQDGIYYTKWKETLSVANGPASNTFMRDKSMAGLPRTLTLHARCGQLNTAKFRYRAGWAQSPNCLLCGQPDGGHHTLSGCPHMQKMYTERHNRAGGIICAAIRKGRLGASLVMQDIGQHNLDASLQDNTCPTHTDSAPHTTTPTVGTRVPEWVYSTVKNNQATSLEWNKLRPDALVVNKMHRLPKHRKVDIVEIKYCRDTDRAPQSMKATTQHMQLRTMLIEAGYKPENIQLHIITLGVTGTIYKDLLPTLELLGVQPEQANACTRQLHLHAIQYVRKIATTKWNNERRQQDKTGVG